MREVNVFESLFGQGTYSVPYQAPERMCYVQRQMEFDGTTLFVDAWIGSDVVDQVQCRKKVGWLREPYCLHPESYQAAYQNRHKFDAILTYNDELLDDDPFLFCPYGGTWIPKDQWGMKPKNRLCSMLVGTKMSTEGHRTRREAADAVAHKLDLFDHKDNAGVTYGLDTKMRTLENYAFTVVVENCWQDNYFDEWLLDAMSQGTIPILWGCENIDEFFDPLAILTWETVGELWNLLDELSFEMYQRMRHAAQRNLAAIGRYAIPEDWAARHYPELFCIE